MANVKIFPHSWLITLFALVVTSLAWAPASAETRYITDECQITLRRGESTEHRVLRSLDSGTAVELLERNRETGYSRVRLSSGMEGWVLDRFLMSVPSARDRLQRAKDDLAGLREKHNTLLQSVKSLRGSGQAAQDKIAQLEKLNAKLDAELKQIRRTAANTLAIAEDNRVQKVRIVELERKMQALHLENADLKDSTARDWFMVGAAVIILGILIGLIAPRIPTRRKSTWDSF